jgi:apolipoprotein N-acyltransferase
VLGYAAVLGAIVLGGTVRLAAAPTDRASLRTATLNRPVDLFIPGEMTRIAEGRVSPDERQPFADKLTRLHDWFLEGSRREARAGARLVVWPEGNLLVFAEDEPAFVERAQRVAAGEGVYLAMGMGTVRPGAALPFENKLVLIDPSGRVIVSYLKSHAVTGWEAGIMRPGDGRVPVTATRDGRIATAICFDADFPEFIRQAAQGSADLLIVPANDWKAIKDIHFQMAAFRAIENGVPLVRAASSGLSSAFDPWGRVLGLADYFAAGDRTMTVQVPLGGVRTLYARTGDLFAWLCVAGLVAALGIAAADPRKLSQVTPGPSPAANRDLAHT